MNPHDKWRFIYNMLKQISADEDYGLFINTTSPDELERNPASISFSIFTRIPEDVDIRITFQNGIEAERFVHELPKISKAIREGYRQLEIKE